MDYGIYTTIVGLYTLPRGTSILVVYIIHIMVYLPMPRYHGCVFLKKNHNPFGVGLLPTSPITTNSHPSGLTVIHFSVQNMGIQRYTHRIGRFITGIYWDIIFVVVPVKLHDSENCSFFQTRRFQGSLSHVSNWWPWRFCIVGVNETLSKGSFKIQ